MTIFVTGNSRSGTTMMSRILGNHADVFTFQELHFFDEVLPPRKYNNKPGIEIGTKLFAKLCAIQRNGYFGSKDLTPFIEEAKIANANSAENTSIQFYNNFLKYETNKNRKTISCEQTPQNIFYLEEIFNGIPDSKVIVMVRDPREVLLSQKNKWKRRKLSGNKIPFWESVRSRINYHPITISRIWNSVMMTADRYKNHQALLFVKYEELILNPEVVIKNICSHCGINYQEGMLNIPVVGSSNFNDTENSLGIDTSKTGQWQNGGLTAAEIHLCQTVNGTQMESYGYKKVDIKPGMVSVAWYKFSLPFRLFLALLFNLKRLKDPGKIVKRFLK